MARYHVLGSDTLRRFALDSASSFASASPLFLRLFSCAVVDSAFCLPFDIGGDAALGFGFFFTRTPFRDFLTSFFAGRGAGGLVLLWSALDDGTAAVIVTGGLLAAVSRAATALLQFQDTRITMLY